MWLIYIRNVMAKKNSKFKRIRDVLIVFGSVFLVWSILDQNRFVVRQQNIRTDKLKKGQSVRFVFVTDLHDKKFAGNNETLLKAIRKCEPDFILCGGDMMTAHPGKNNVNTVSFMQRLSKEYKIYYALGNHEFRARLYPETYGDMYDEYMEAIDSENIVFLDDESVMIPDLPVRIQGLTIGREYYKRFSQKQMPKDYIEKKLGKINPEEYTILLAHDPDYGEEYFDYGADLFLSGHLHGGIVRLPYFGGAASPSFRLFPKFDGGLYERGEKKGYVSCGLGTHTIPMRINNPGEVTCITVTGIHED